MFRQLRPICCNENMPVHGPPLDCVERAARVQSQIAGARRQLPNLSAAQVPRWIAAQRFVSAVAAVRTALEAGIDSVFNLDHTVTTTDCGAISVRSAGHHLHVHFPPLLAGVINAIPATMTANSKSSVMVRLAQRCALVAFL